MPYSRGKIESQLNEVEKLLKRFSLLEQRNYNPSPPKDSSIFKGLNYVDIWKLISANKCFHFQLVDNSFLLFRYNLSAAIVLSFSFYECPLICVSYSEFLSSIGLEDDERAFYNEYEIYLGTCARKDSYAGFRYDYYPNDYNEGLHPASHLHVGIGNNIRLGIDKIISPLSFFFMVLRQHYPLQWVQFTKSNCYARYEEHIKDRCVVVSGEHWNAKDKVEIHLT